MSDAEIIEEEEEGGRVVSERVQALAKGIYDELQSLVDQFGGESISNIMPLVVNVLENLDSSLSDNQDHLTALDDLNEENQQLSKQYQREKQRRREAEEKAMRLEDISELEQRELKDKNSRLAQDNSKNQRSRVRKNRSIVLRSVVSPSRERALISTTETLT